MKRRTAARLAWVLWAVFFPLVAATKYLESRGDRIMGSTVEWLSFIVAFGVLATVGALVASRRPSNAIGWILLGVALGTWFTAFAAAYATYGLIVRPGSLPGATVMAWFQSWTWYPSIGVLATFLILLFPTGHPPSPRWRPLAWADALMIGALVLAAALAPRVEIGGETERQRIVIDNPVGVESAGGVLETLEGTTGFVFLALVALGVASVFFRYRAAGHEQRQQLKWFLYATGLFVVGMTIGELAPDWSGGNILFAALVSLIPISVAVAILRYRLYDIDLVINKTLVYGALATFITAVYVGVVVGLGSLIGTRGEPNLILQVAATALVAVAFQPVRAWVQRLANRLVYGRRASPYETLTRFSDRVSGTYAAEEVLSRMVRVVAEGTGAREASVWLRIGGELRQAARLPEGNGDRPFLPLAGEGVMEVPGADRTVPIRHRDELLGVLAVAKAPGDPLRPQEEGLLRDLASQAGLVLRNVRLTTELRARLEEVSRLAEDLRASRRRLVATQDASRRGLERDIHDGAQQHLVALAVQLKLAQTVAARDPEKARPLLEGLLRATDEALRNLRDLTRGVYPPLLEAEGLRAALRAEAARAPVPVTVEADGVGRTRPEVEAAVYFSVLEALQNAAKYAEASRVEVRLEVGGDDLRFEVVDDGRGFDPATTPPGSGIQNMRDRLQALGGEMELRSAPGRGTNLRGSIPKGGERGAA